MDYERDIRERWFKDHVATYNKFTEGNDEIERIIWKKPGTSNYLVYYIFHRGILTITGDVDDATYNWPHGGFSFEQIANCDVHYFHGKCGASPVGIPYNEWDEEKAKKRIENYFGEKFDFAWKTDPSELGEIFSKHNSNKDRENYIQQNTRYIETQFGYKHPWYSKEDWHDLLNHHGFEAFGDNYSELGDIGTQINFGCYVHKIGLEMAFAQIRESVL